MCFGFSPRRDAAILCLQLHDLVARSKSQGRIAIVLLDNAGTQRSERSRLVRQTLARHGDALRLVYTPAYDPDSNPIEAIWGWIREEVTANTCFGTAAKVRESVDAFFRGVAERMDEVKQRCRTVLQARADALAYTQDACHGDPVAA